MENMASRDTVRCVSLSSILKLRGDDWH
jgi:hypothetical protein